MMGRHPICLTEAQKVEVETLASVLTAEQVADYFGIGRRTFYSMMQRDEEIAARYKRGKAKAIGVIAQGLINKARSGDTACMIFFLKTQAGWRETLHVAPADAPEQDLLDLAGLGDAVIEEIVTVLQRATAAARAEAPPEKGRIRFEESAFPMLPSDRAARSGERYSCDRRD